MPGLIRKLIVFATIDGLVIQPSGHGDQSAALRIDYKSHRPVSWGPSPLEIYRKNTPLETHGIIGLLNVAPFSFLIAITQREQVAQIFGKPVYIITGVALLPLSSELEATTAIEEANAAVQKSKAAASSESDSDDGSDGDQSPEELPPTSQPEAPSSAIDASIASKREDSSRSIVKDVIGRKGYYGRFASQWFSRRGWGPGSKQPEEIDAEPDRTEVEQSNPSRINEDSRSDTAGASPKGAEQIGRISRESDIIRQRRKSGWEQSTMPGAKEEQRESSDSADNSTVALLPKLIRSTKLILTSRSFYFSYDYNLTTRLVRPSQHNSPTGELWDPTYFWNWHLRSPFATAGHSTFIMPIVQGFVGQTPFIVKETEKDNTHTKAIESLEKVLSAENTNANADQIETGTQSSQSLLLTLISRRSTARAGLRYLRRGVDDNGNCANTVETEQILSSPTWDGIIPIRAFVQIRGSIPLYFSQSPFSFKPVPVPHQSQAVNQAAFERHFETLRQRYGSVQIASLVDKHGGEAKIGEEYEAATKRSIDSGHLHDLGFEWFDFHTECRGMKFENVDRLVKALGDTLASFGETVVENKATKRQQTGVVRTNCMDCLDRTNVAQSAFAQYMLQKDIESAGSHVDFMHDPSTQWFNTLWADNGDAISRQYSSTAALKGDYTRTRKRNYRGALNDFGLTLSRYYNNTINDYFSQAVIDVLLGNVSTKVFDDFEATMMSVDPGISVPKMRQAAIENCSKIVIQNAEEDLIHGWAMLSPAQPNTLRTLPFEESVLLLTDAALYGCKFDWDSEKVASFEKIDLRFVTSIHYGTYVTSTLTEKQADEKLNVGIVISYTPGKESIIRVNTRSLHNTVNTSGSEAIEADESSTESKSWFGGGPKSPPPDRIMALKIIAIANGGAQPEPLALAEQISHEIQRAVRGVSISSREEKLHELVKKSDIISLAEARKRTGYLEQLGHSIKKLVWV